MKIRYLATVAAAAAFIAVPASAIAVNVSSNDGSGVQYAQTWYGCGSTTSGLLKSTAGNPVYYNGTAVYDGEADTNFGRYTSDTTSTTSVGRYGTIGTTSSGCGIDGIKMKVCRNKNNLPDPCGSNSATIRR